MFPREPVGEGQTVSNFYRQILYLKTAQHLHTGSFPSFLDKNILCLAQHLGELGFMTFPSLSVFPLFNTPLFIHFTAPRASRMGPRAEARAA